MKLLGILLIAGMTLAAEKGPRGERWQYDPGPDVSTPVGDGYARIIAETPNFRKIGEILGRGDKFRWKFGPMFYRGRLSENGVKVLLIGQEGAQEENVSFRSFTGGTGGRMQNFLSYLGIHHDYLFVNTFVYTISGQYADFAPRLEKNEAGYEYLRWDDQLTWEMLKLSQIPHASFEDGHRNVKVSPIVAQRHKLLDHVIASNKKSLRLIVAVGGAAQDTLATYIQHRGGTCSPYISDAEKVQKVQYGSIGAGGNRRFFFPAGERGENLLLTAQERKTKEFEFGNLKGQPIYFSAKDSRDRHPDKVMADLKLRAEPGKQDSRFWQDNPNQYAAYAAFSKDLKRNLVRLDNGPFENGFEDLAQLTMNLESCEVNGKRNSLQGLDNVDTEVRFVTVMHPGSNSPRLLSNFSNALAKVRGFTEEGWSIEPDTDADGKKLAQPLDKNFKYDAKPVPYWDFRFGQLDYLGGSGTTTTTRRDGGRAIEVGSRNSGSYPRLSDWKDAYTPSVSYMSKDVGWEPNKTDYQDFDFGPGEFWAKVFAGSDKAENAQTLGTEIFTIPGLPSHVKFGARVTYRGTPARTEVLVLADQYDHDDMWVGRALMGLEGQKLQSFLEQIGVDSDYTIFRTLPIDTLGASEETVDALLDLTKDYRKHVVKLLTSSEENELDVKLVLVRGKQAEKTLRDYSSNLKGKEVVIIGDDYAEAYAQVLKSTAWKARNKELGKVMAKTYDEGAIPIRRADIPYGLPRWVGTAGNRVMAAKGKYAGELFKIVAPEWSTSGRYAQPKALTRPERDALAELDLLP